MSGRDSRFGPSYAPSIRGAPAPGNRLLAGQSGVSATEARSSFNCLPRRLRRFASVLITRPQARRILHIGFPLASSSTSLSR